MKNKWLLLLLSVLATATVGRAASRDRGVDLSLNLTPFTYDLRSPNLGLALDLMVNLSDRIGLFIQGNGLTVPRHGGADLFLYYIGIETKFWNIQNHRKIFFRVGAGLHTMPGEIFFDFNDRNTTISVMTGAGVQWKISKLLIFRGPEIDLILGKHDRNEKSIIISFRMLLGFCFHIGK